MRLRASCLRRVGPQRAIAFITAKRLKSCGSSVARGLGFTLAEIKDIVAIKRAGRAPCPHVRQLIRHKLEGLETVRERLCSLLDGWRTSQGRAAICPHIETTMPPRGRTKR
jgi:MerR, DNA binding